MGEDRKDSWEQKLFNKKKRQQRFHRGGRRSHSEMAGGIRLRKHDLLEILTVALSDDAYGE